ncbi:MAG: DMT family transporter, partial [Cyanobacteria bacterium J06636_16]
VAAGIAYALYTVNAQKSFAFIHPVTYTWMSFAVTLLIAALCLLAWPLQEATTLAWGPICVWSLVSGLVTFVGHVLYNSGIQYIGATNAAMVGTANPAFTVVVAWAAIQEMLGIVQLVGVGIVIASVAFLSRLSISQKR